MHANNKLTTRKSELKLFIFYQKHNKTFLSYKTSYSACLFTTKYTKSSKLYMVFELVVMFEFPFSSYT